MWQGDEAAWIRVGPVWRGSLKTRPRENIEEKRSHNKLPYAESLTNIVAINMARPSAGTKFTLAATQAQLSDSRFPVNELPCHWNEPKIQIKI